MNVETFSSPRQGMQRVREVRPDIVFLDIEMNGTSGLELARELPSGCCLIFTTAYAHYALDGFEANAVDFLHKPFFYDRFLRAVQKAETWLQMNSLLVSAESPTRQLVLKVEYRNVALSFDEIVYVEAMENYVKVHRSDRSTVVSQVSLRAMEEQLPAGDFVRVHRSYIVRRALIASFTRTSLTLTGVDEPIPIGRKYNDEVVSLFGNG